MIRFLILCVGITRARNQHHHQHHSPSHDRPVSPEDWHEMTISPSSGGNLAALKPPEQKPLHRQHELSLEDKPNRPKPEPDPDDGKDETLHTATPPWEEDSVRLAQRLEELKAMHGGEENSGVPAAAPKKRRGPWPDATIDFDRSRGVDNSMYAQDPALRCSLLSQPRAVDPALPPQCVASRSGRPKSHRREIPIAILLVAQLRTAEVTLPFLEENVIHASAPAPIHIFAHVWSLQDSSPVAAATHPIDQSHDPPTADR